MYPVDVPVAMRQSRPFRDPISGRRYLAVAAVVGLALCLVGFLMDLCSASVTFPELHR